MQNIIIEIIKASLSKQNPGQAFYSIVRVIASVLLFIKLYKTALLFISQ